MSRTAALQTAHAKPLSASGQGILLQRKCACGGSAGLSGECEECGKKKMLGIQTKLAIGEPGDQYEQEADRVAEQVVRMEEPATRDKNRPSLEQSLLQRRATEGNAGFAEAPPEVEDVLSSPGQPLDPASRAFFEPRFGHDFSRVRVHTGGAAEASAREVNAHAYTVGRDIVFGASRFAPLTRAGQRLIAHELAHVVQQSGANTMDPSAIRHLSLQHAFQAFALQRQESSDAEGSEGEAQPAGIRDWIFGKDRRVECAHELGKCNLTCRRFSTQSQAYERCMKCCNTGYDICLDVGAFVTPEGGCARG